MSIVSSFGLHHSYDGSIFVKQEYFLGVGEFVPERVSPLLARATAGYIETALEGGTRIEIIEPIVQGS